MASASSPHEEFRRVDPEIALDLLQRVKINGSSSAQRAIDAVSAFVSVPNGTYRVLLENETKAPWGSARRCHNAKTT